MWAYVFWAWNQSQKLFQFQFERCPNISLPKCFLIIVPTTVDSTSGGKPEASGTVRGLSWPTHYCTRPCKPPLVLPSRFGVSSSLGWKRKVTRESWRRLPFDTVERSFSSSFRKQIRVKPYRLRRTYVRLWKALGLCIMGKPSGWPWVPACRLVRIMPWTRIPFSMPPNKPSMFPSGPAKSAFQRVEVLPRPLSPFIVSSPEVIAAANSSAKASVYSVILYGKQERGTISQSIYCLQTQYIDADDAFSSTFFYNSLIINHNFLWHIFWKK